MRTFLLSLFIISVGLTGCNTYTQDDYNEYYVVEAYLTANKPLAQVRLSTTAPIDQYYTFASTAISGAQVEIRLLDENGTATEEVFVYTDSEPGVYVSTQAHNVLPTRTYQLHITVPGSGDDISAKTIVPGGFSIADTQPDTLVYQGGEQVEITMTKSEYPGRQSIYIFNIEALDPALENFTPFYLDFFDEDEEDVEDYRVVSSGILNEAGLTNNSDGTITVKYPWIGVAFYGESKVVANTIDDNIYDFIRSEEVQLGGSTLSPGEIQNVITHIQGGLGVFGSYASDTLSTYFKRNPDLGF